MATPHVVVYTSLTPHNDSSWNRLTPDHRKLFGKIFDPKFVIRGITP